jgi:hypothetical protein
MELSKIKNTCSMFELGDVNYLEDKTKKNFDTFIIQEFVKLGINPNKENYAIIYNCTNSTNYKAAKKLGFKQVARYKGYSHDRDVKVLIWKSNKYSLIEKLEVFFKFR